MSRRYRVQSKTPHPYDTPAEMSPVGRFYCGRCNAATEHQVHVFEPADGGSKVSKGCANCYAEGKAERGAARSWVTARTSCPGCRDGLGIQHHPTEGNHGVSPTCGKDEQEEP